MFFVKNKIKKILSKIKLVTKKQEKCSFSAFTIIELLTAIAVFTLVVTAVLGIYTVTIQKHFQAQKIQTVDEELRYVIEVIARDIKDGYLVGVEGTGSNYKYPTIYIANKNKLTDEDYNNCLINPLSNKDKCVKYKIDTSNKYILVKYGSKDSSEVRLTSPKITILSNSWFLVAAKPTSSLVPVADSPLITIQIAAQASNDQEGASKIELRTTVNQTEVVNYYQGSL